MKHDPYSLTELIRNDEFIAWVMHPDAMSDVRWNLFLENYPEKKATVESAREYVILLAKDTGKQLPTARQSDKMWRVVESQMHEEVAEIAPQGKVVSGWRWIRVAASAALILSIGSVSYWFYYKEIKKGSVAAVEASEPARDIIQKHNETGKPMMILLQDGSSVVLQPGGYLSYTEKPDQKRREVTLRGQAFFEIVKNKEKPFLVYSYGLATKVLGTSFLIDASEGSKEIKVEVKTGTVAVFSMKDLSGESKAEMIDRPELTGVTLNHNQRIAFSRESGKISKIIDQKVVLKDLNDISKQQFFFDETPVSQVFLALEKAYNVRIRYDEVLMGNCPLNATLVGQPFREKMEVICNALDAQFTIDENEVTIVGKGCR
jgi:hypothetical protein